MTTQTRESHTREKLREEDVDDATMATTTRVDGQPVAEPVRAEAAHDEPAGRLSGVSVYDRTPAQTLDPALGPNTPAAPTAPMGDTPYSDRVPVEPRSTGSIVTWFIGAAILVVVAYFLVQMLF